MIGKIKNVFGRGFGFIETEDRDIFFHCSEMESRLDFESLQVGQEVEFEVEKAEDGREQAVKVQKVEVREEVKSGEEHNTIGSV